MTNIEILKWIKINLAADINKAIADTGTDLYTEDWLGAMVCRETCDLIARYAPIKSNVLEIASLMRGDFTQRHGETEKQYHGYGFIQIDRQSYPAFVMSGKWKIPYENFKAAILILEEKRKYLTTRFAALTGDSLKHYITAAFNCGQGNESKVITNHLDPDAYTAAHNYSAQVFEFATIYITL